MVVVDSPNQRHMLVLKEHVCTPKLPGIVACMSNTREDSFPLCLSDVIGCHSRQSCLAAGPDLAAAIREARRSAASPRGNQFFCLGRFGRNFGFVAGG